MRTNHDSDSEHGSSPRGAKRPRICPVLEPGALSTKVDIEIVQAFAIGQLRERQPKDLVGAAEPSYVVIAVPFDHCALKRFHGRTSMGRAKTNSPACICGALIRTKTPASRRSLQIVRHHNNAYSQFLNEVRCEERSASPFHVDSLGGRGEQQRRAIDHNAHRTSTISCYSCLTADASAVNLSALR